MSTITGNVVNKAQDTNPEIPAHVIASALAIIAGAIICFIGLVRMGRIVDFISLAAISAFMTGSAINISVGQVPALMGITGFSNREATYKVVINILKHLGRSKRDAAMGLTALFFLYLVRSLCNFGARRMPHRAKAFFFLSTLRTAFTILLYTLISWLVNRHHRSKKARKFAILGTVPRGEETSLFITRRTVLTSPKVSRMLLCRRSTPISSRSSQAKYRLQLSSFSSNTLPSPSHLAE